MDTEEKAYSEGHFAYHDGYRLKHNPYKRFTPEWEQWKEGWSDEKSEDPYWENVRRIQNNAKRRFSNKA